MLYDAMFTIKTHFFPIEPPEERVLKGNISACQKVINHPSYLWSIQLSPEGYGQTMSCQKVHRSKGVYKKKEKKMP